MPDLTNEEYDALDEYWTAHTPTVSGNGKGGFFAKHTGRAVFVDDVSVNWLNVKAAADHTTPEAIVGELVRREIAAAMA